MKRIGEFYADDVLDGDMIGGIRASRWNCGI